MDSIARLFVDKSRALLVDDYLVKIDRCLDALTLADVWWRPNAASNSIGNLMLHLNGNVTMWILGGVGRLLCERNRPLEFDERANIPVGDLKQLLEGTVARANQVIGTLDEDALASRRQIQGYDVTVLEAIYHVVEHFGMHTGQIILLAKARARGQIRLWEPPRP